VAAYAGRRQLRSAPGIDSGIPCAASSAMRPMSAARNFMIGNVIFVTVTSQRYSGQFNDIRTCSRIPMSVGRKSRLDCRPAEKEPPSQESAR
jgi:hypothetical protein